VLLCLPAEASLPAQKIAGQAGAQAGTFCGLCGVNWQTETVPALTLVVVGCYNDA